MNIRRSLKLEMKRIEECNIFQDSEELFTIDEGKESVLSIIKRKAVRIETIYELLIFVLLRKQNM